MDKKSKIQFSKNIIKDYPYQDIIKELFNTEVKKMNKEGKNSAILNQIAQAMQGICKKPKPIKKTRRNEVGNAMEEVVILALNTQELSAEKPQTKTGKKKAGYPDIKITIPNAIPIYLEVKTYDQKHYESHLRSFFFSPSKDPKIIEDAFHLLVGFEMVEQNKECIPIKYEIIDLYDVKCDLKQEFNTNNKRLYNTETTLVKGNKDGFQYLD